MKKQLLLQIILILLPLCLYAQKEGKIKFGEYASYKGIVSNNNPMGKGLLTFKWSKDQAEKIIGVFNGNVVSDAQVDLIPEGCHYSGILKYEINSNEGIIYMNFVKGVLTIGSNNYNIKNILYESNSKSKVYSLGTKQRGEFYNINVVDMNASDMYSVDFMDFYKSNRGFPQIKEIGNENTIIRKNVKRTNILQLKITDRTIEILNENGIPKSSIISNDGEMIIRNQTLTYNLSKSLKLIFTGIDASSNKFKVEKNSSIELELKDKTKINGKPDVINSYLGSIQFSNGNIYNGKFSLNVNNTLVQYVNEATEKDITLTNGRMTNTDGTIIAIKEAQQYIAGILRAPGEEILDDKQIAEREEKEWASIPLKNYSGPYQLNTYNVGGYANYSYKEVDGQRIYEKEFNYESNYITISGQYKKGMKNGRWIYNVKDHKIRMEVDYKDGIRYGMYKYTQHDKNGNLLVNVTLKMANNYVVGIENAFISNMYFGSSNYADGIIIKKAQIKAAFIADGRLDGICEIIDLSSKDNRFLYYEKWSYGLLQEVYYYNNMTGDNIKLSKRSGIVTNIVKIIENGYDLAESIIDKGFNVWKHKYAHLKNYFHGDYWEEHRN